MSLFDDLGLAFRSFFVAPQRPSTDITQTIFGIEPSWTGITVSEVGSLNASVVYSATRTISDAMASLPLILYEVDGKGVKHRAVNHTLYKVLHDQPNKWMTAYEYRAVKYAHLNLWGNSYSEIEFDSKGNVIGLFPIRPDKVTVQLENGELFYIVAIPNAQSVRLPAYRVHHVKNMSLDGFVGLSPIQQARNALGLAFASEEYGSRWFGSGGKPSGILTHPGQLTQEAYDRLKEGWNDSNGLSEQQRVRILEEGLTYTQVSLPPEDSQFLQTRRFQTSELARFFRVPSALIGDTEGVTYGSAEQMAIDFVTNTLRPWASNDEQAIKRDLLIGSDKQKYDAEYLFDDLLRSDTQSRAEAFRTFTNNGIMSINEVRRKENLPPIENGNGYYLPLNVGLIAPDGNLNAPVQVRSQEIELSTADYEWRESRPIFDNREVRSARAIDARSRLAEQYIDILSELLQRTVKKEARDIRKQVELLRSDPEGFFTWLRGYKDELTPFLLRTLVPVLRTLMLAVIDTASAELDKDSVGLTDAFKAWSDGYGDRYADQYCQSSYEQLRALYEDSIANGGDTVEIVSTRLDEWEDKRADKEARNESFNFNNAATVAVWQGYRVERMKWRANAGACPICKQMDGRTVAITESFLSKGDTLEGDGTQESLTVQKSLRHPPLHGACSCGISAEQ